MVKMYPTVSKMIIRIQNSMHVSQGFPQGFGDRGGQIRGGGGQISFDRGGQRFFRRVQRARKKIT